MFIVTRPLEAAAPGAAPVLSPGPVLVATDARPSTGPAVRAAHEIGQRLGRGVERVDCATEVLRGDPAEAIAAAGRRHDAAVVVMGLGHHALIDRLFARDPSAGMAHRADRPLLAVAASWDLLPETIMIAVDLGDTSERVVATTGALFPDADTVHLVHVMPRSNTVVVGVANWEGIYKRQLAAQYANIRDLLPRSTRVIPTTLRGDPATELRDFAARTEPDLFVEGVHSHGLLHRVIFDDLPVRALRAATTSVLLVPG